MKKPELLLPAGGRAALEAAIEGGADAVYMGAAKFNARMRAENFAEGELSDALSLAKAYGVKTYITLNTRLFDSELSEALALASELYSAGADALIVADMGIASLIREHIPDFELHASTQLSGHSICDAAELERAGFSRMVCHREITRDGLFHLCKGSPIEIEMFVHGAYCVSFSGQCLMSAVMGGRSGNRGECAQPCRQPYKKANSKTSAKDYPISLKDMCLAGHIEDIIKTGVSSLKIEGRQKSPEYVYGVAKIYRRLLDEGRNATPDEVEALRRIFSRDGFSDGYFTADHSHMRGVRTYEDFLAMDKSKFQGLTKKEKAKVTLTAMVGKEASFEIATSHKSFTAIGEKLERAESIAPLSYEGALKNSQRLGSTPFVLSDFEFITDSNAALTLSSLNALRRRACEGLLSIEREKIALPSLSPPKAKKPKGEKTMFTAEFLSAAQITPLCESFFDRIYLPFGAHDERHGISLPPYMPDEKCSFVLEAARDRDVLCSSLGQMKLVKDTAREIAGSLRLNIFNSESAKEYSALSPLFITCAPEMKKAQIRDLSSPSPVCAVVYGRLPLMLTVRCAICDGECKKKDKASLCPSSITDRHGVCFPLYGMPDCTNVIYNSVPIYMADRQKELSDIGISVFHFIFTDESPEECEAIINAYKNSLPPRDSDKIRRMN